MDAVLEPDSFGLSSERLQRLGDHLRNRVDQKEVAGAVMLVARRGVIGYFESFGFRDREADVPMGRDAIFRLASITKPLTSLAALMLVEQGDLRLDMPVSEYLPQLKSLKVGTARPDGSLALAPPRREARILDLLRHTSGFTYGHTGNSPVKRAYQESGIGAFAGSASDYLAKVAELPLEYEPGTTWAYSISTDVLGHVVEAISGVTLEQFIARHITEPLGMTDTAFWIDETRRGRIAEPQIDLQTGTRTPMPDVTQRFARSRGGGGMVSTAGDYGRFCQFLLNGGTLDGVRLVSRKTVELMTADHLPPGTAFDAECKALLGAILPSPELGAGFGLGFAVRTHVGRAPRHGSVGTYEWGGASGCIFFVDPQEQLYAVLFMQAGIAGNPWMRNMLVARALVYQAIAD
jgi:CubicO group peptidase (beta-lactamase class C family)